MKNKCRIGSGGSAEYCVCCIAPGKVYAVSLVDVQADAAVTGRQEGELLALQSRAKRGRHVRPRRGRNGAPRSPRRIDLTQIH